MKLVTYRELAEYLNIPIGTLYAWVCQGTIPHIRISSRTVRFDLAQIDAWLRDRQEGQS